MHVPCSRRTVKERCWHEIKQVAPHNPETSAGRFTTDVPITDRQSAAWRSAANRGIPVLGSLVSGYGQRIVDHSAGARPTSARLRQPYSGPFADASLGNWRFRQIAGGCQRSSGLDVRTIVRLQAVVPRWGWPCGATTGEYWCGGLVLAHGRPAKTDNENREVGAIYHSGYRLKRPPRDGTDRCPPVKVKER